MISKSLGLSLTVSLLSVLAWSQVGSAQDTQGRSESIADQIDNKLLPAFKDDRPGAAVIVAVDGEVVFRRGYGLASVELAVPIEPDMVFRAASITKEFTSVLVMQLVEQGLISLDDEVTKYLPGYPVQGHTVTIAHLLSHTAGVTDYVGLEAFQDRVREDHTLDDIIAYFADQPFESAPGEQYSYSNSEYILLGAILEEVTGKTYEELLRENIFYVIGMNSSYVSSHDDIIPQRVSGYTEEEGIVYNSSIVSMTASFSSGSLMTSVDDLATWDEALYGNELLSDQSKERMWSPFTLNDGQTTDYGLGWMVTSFLGRRVLMHDGWVDGFLASAMRLPDEHIFVSVLSNTDSPEMGPNVAAKEILALLLGTPEKIAIHLDQEILARYAGDYIRTNGRVWKIVAEDGKLFLAPNESFRFEIFPRTESSFFFEDGFETVVFEFDDDGAVTDLVFTLDTGVDEIRAHKDGSAEG